MTQPFSSETLYYPRESREFLEMTIQAVRRRALERKVNTICVFTSQGTGALALSTKVSDLGLKVIAVTFPPYRRYVRRTDASEEEVTVGITDPEIERALRRNGVEIVRGSMPLDGILIPRSPDQKTEAIRHTLWLFGVGMVLCVQAVLMACDAGMLQPQQEVISMASDTAILATAAPSRVMFSIDEGMEIREIICKPRHLTAARSGLYEKRGAEWTLPS